MNEKRNIQRYDAGNFPELKSYNSLDWVITEYRSGPSKTTWPISMQMLIL